VGGVLFSTAAWERRQSGAVKNITVEAPATLAPHSTTTTAHPLVEEEEQLGEETADEEETVVDEQSPQQHQREMDLMKEMRSFPVLQEAHQLSTQASRDQQARAGREATALEEAFEALAETAPVEEGEVARRRRLLASGSMHSIGPLEFGRNVLYVSVTSQVRTRTRYA
jgi:hypothetical protein